MTTTPPESLFNRLEPLLAQVTKPIQYVGGELNAVTKDWVGTDVHWALMYPDAYEVGQPNQGQAILYEVLNEVDWVLAERVFSVWSDLEQRMRAVGLPLLIRFVRFNTAKIGVIIETTKHFPNYF